MNVKPFAKLLAHRPKTVLLVFTLFTVLIGWQASNIYMESDFAKYLPSDDPTLELWGEINQEFQIGQTIIILVDQSDGLYDVRDPKVLTEMDEVSRKIDKYENDKGENDGIFSITSLASMIKKEHSGSGNLKEIPEDKDVIYRYLEGFKIRSMKGVLFTNDYDYAVIIIRLSENADFDEILSRTENAVEKYGNDETEMTITGTIAMQKAIRNESMKNFFIIFPIAIVLVSIVLFLFHRTIKGIIIAFLPPAFAIALTFGVLGIVQPELTVISAAIVALLMGLGVDYSIHLMNRLSEERRIENKIKRMELVLKSTGKAVLLSTVTTMIGFASLMISSMSPMVTFGFGCAIGIFFCFISAIVMVPCLVIILKFEKNGEISSWKKFARFTIKNRKRIIFVASFLAILSLIVIPEVKTDVNYLEMAPEGIPEVEGMFEYSNNFGGGSNFNALLIETDPNGLLDPDVINSICIMEDEMRAVIGDEFKHIEDSKIEKSVYSVADEIKSVTDIINRSIILEKLGTIIGVEKIIFDMIAEEGIIDKDFSKTIVMVSIPIGGSIEQIEKVVNGINSIASATVLPHNGHVSQLTGQDAVVVAVNNKLTDEQVRSMIVALILVLAALILIFRSSTYGLLTMIPVIFVLMWEPGFLVALDIPLSLVTISIASIMVGVGIDYGVHITHRFREEIAKGASKTDAIKISIEKTGLSLLEAALTTIVGAASIYFVNIPALQEFVTVIIVMIALSCIAAALLLPVFYDLKRVK